MAACGWFLATLAAIGAILGRFQAIGVQVNRREFLAATTALTTTAILPVSSQSASPDIGGQLDSYLAPFVASRDFSGVIVLTRGGQTVTTRTYGCANFEFDIPNTVNTRFWAGSISKLFTRAALVALEGTGKLKQDDLLSKYLPGYPNSHAITIRQLVQHRAGIARDLILGTDQIQPHTTEEIVELVAKIPPIAKPGEKESYSNNGYRILARVLEVAGNDAFADIVHDTVFQPLGMHDTLQPDLLDVVPRMASGYVAGPGYGTLRHAAPFNVLNEPGAGAFYSTPDDLLKFCKSLPIEPSDLVPETPASNNQWSPPRSVGHDGLGNGFAAYCYRFPDENACMIMMANIETGLFAQLNTDLRRMMFGQPVTPPAVPPPAKALDDRRAEIYVGRYDLFPGVPLIVRKGSDALELSAGDAFFFPMVPVGGDDFFLRLKFAYVHFDVQDHKSVSITWKQDGQTYTLKRLAS